MRIEGRITPPRGKEKYWAVSLDSLAIFTQGKNLKDAYRMAADAVETLAADAGTPFEATIEEGSEPHTFTVRGSNEGAFLRFAFRRMRAAKHLTLMEVSERLDSNSPNTYAKFERGTIPRLDTLEELIHAIDPSLQLVLKKRA